MYWINYTLFDVIIRQIWGNSCNRKYGIYSYLTNKCKCKLNNISCDNKFHNNARSIIGDNIVKINNRYLTNSPDVICYAIFTCFVSPIFFFFCHYYSETVVALQILTNCRIPNRKNLRNSRARLWNAPRLRLRCTRFRTIANWTSRQIVIRPNRSTGR